MAKYLTGRKHTPVPLTEEPVELNSPLGVDSLFGLDYRSMALFRVSLGIVTIADVLRRSLDFTAHYTNVGLLPNADIMVQAHKPWIMNLYPMFDSMGWPIFLAVLTIVSSLFVISGLFTRIAWAASWVLMVSLINRNDLVNCSGDVFLRLLYFWGLFLPLGAKYSLDSFWRGVTPPKEGPRFLSAATLAITVQFAILYFFAALLKSDPDWHQKGTAVYFALHMDKYALPLGKWLRESRIFSYWATRGTWYFELFAPILLFSPFAFRYLRLGATLGLIVMHLGFDSCFRLGTFPWICIGGLTVLLPDLFWEGAFLYWRKMELSAQIDRLLAFVSSMRLKNLVAKLPPLPRFRAMSFLANAVSGGALFSVILWNLSGLPGTGIDYPQSFIPYMRMLGLDQHWNMFAPRPGRGDGWVVVPGTLASGKAVDVWYLDENPVNWNKPKDPIAYNYSTERWIKYFENLSNQGRERERKLFAAYLCRKWNNHFHSSDPLKSLEIYFMDDPTSDNGKETPNPISLLKYDCPL